MRHTIKCWPQYFSRVIDGSKTFEVRENDRGYQPGDEIRMVEFDPKKVYHAQHPMDDDHDGLTGRFCDFKVGYVLPIDDKRVVFSVLNLVVSK